MVSSPRGGIMYRSEGTSEAQAVVFLSIDGTSELRRYYMVYFQKKKVCTVMGLCGGPGAEQRMMLQ